MNIVIRADASTRIGSGHLMRCLSLAGELDNRGASIHFICRALPGHLVLLIEQQGFSLSLLATPGIRDDRGDIDNDVRENPGVSWREDLEDTIEAIGNSQPDWLIVDHYGLDYRWQEEVSRHVGRLMVISDNPGERLYCDLILDQTYGRELADYANYIPEHCYSLLGSRFALLRPEFAQLRTRAFGRRRQFSGINNILVAMGGADEGNVTSTILKGLDEVFQESGTHVDVVLGGSAPHLQTVHQLAQSLSIKASVSSDVNDMAERMLQADLAFGGGGTTSWERCCLGLPAIISVIADNQLEIGKQLSTAGAIVLMPNGEELKVADVSELAQEISGSMEKWKAMRDAAFRITDGLGARRAALEIMPPCATDGPPVRLRPVTMDDAEQLFKWQADPNTRRYSHNPEIPEHSEHMFWMEGRISNMNAYTEIILHDNEPSGVVRLDPVGADGDDIYLLSIYVSPDKYRLGLGKATLTNIQYVFQQAELRAEVHDDNRASIALFRSAGFNEMEGVGYVSQRNNK